MLKCTDAYTMIQQKISRNKSIITHELKIKQVNMLVEMQEKIKNQNTQSKHH